MHATIIKILNIRAIIDNTIPAVAVPVGAPTSIAFLLPMIPRIKPIIAVINPIPYIAPIVSDTIPSTSDAVTIPLPG